MQVTPCDVLLNGVRDCPVARDLRKLFTGLSRW